MSAYPRCAAAGCRIAGTFDGPDGDPRCGFHRNVDVQFALDVAEETDRAGY